MHQVTLLIPYEQCKDYERCKENLNPFARKNQRSSSVKKGKEIYVSL